MVSPHVVQARLGKMMMTQGFGLYAAYLNQKPGVMLQEMEDQLVYLARYMHQSVEYLETQTTNRLNHWTKTVTGFVKAELGGTEDKETAWE